GSGLGLSMVYGFVRQSGGHVRIDSTVGQGTTVKIYLPQVLAEEAKATSSSTGGVAGGTETVLVVEDDDAVRTVVVETMAELGYRVLQARDASSAIKVIESGLHIDLLFTDVVMPGPVQSSQLSRRARQCQPGIAILFTSGYVE